MSDVYIVKIQTETTGKKVLIYPEKRDFQVEISGEDARRIIDCYGLGPLSKTFSEAEVDENGMLHLGHELENQWW